MADITIRDVAKQAGVGVGTVSRVLNDNPAVSPATRQKVMAVINDLGYVPNPIARRLSLGKSLAIAVIVPFFTRPVFVERLRGIEHALAESEYDLILFNVESTIKRDDYFLSIPRGEPLVDGLLVISLSPQDSHVERFLEAEMPTVLVDAYHPRLNRVVIDDVAGGYMATHHLIELGHHKIAYVSDRLDNPFHFTSSRDRYKGYRQVLAEVGLPFRPEYHRQTDHGRQQAHQAAQALLALPEPPTAIFAASDTQAIGVLQAAQEAGLSVPQDLSVIGYDDIEVAEYLHLTTVRQPSFELGINGVDLLLEIVAQPSSSSKKVLMPVELVVRNTTAPPG